MSGISPQNLSLNTATVRMQWNLEQCIEGCARHQIAGIAPWRDKLHEMGTKKAAKSIRDAGLKVSGLCRGGWYTYAGEINKDVVEDNRRAVDEAAELGAACLVMVVGGLPGNSRDLKKAWALVEEGLEKTLEFARKSGVLIAIEPLHPMYAADRACVNTMRQALDLCDRLGPGVGCAVDVYHVWWDPELEEQLKRAGKERIMAFHLCDWLVPTRDLLNDRGMMGDGVIDIPLLRSYVEKNGYEGLYEVEIFSELDWWKRDPDEVLTTIIDRAQSVC